MVLNMSKQKKIKKSAKKFTKQQEKLISDLIFDQIVYGQAIVCLQIDDKNKVKMTRIVPSECGK